MRLTPEGDSSKMDGNPTGGQGIFSMAGLFP
jgi:hypothetical protein